MTGNAGTGAYGNGPSTPLENVSSGDTDNALAAVHNQKSQRGSNDATGSDEINGNVTRDIDPLESNEGTAFLFFGQN